MDGNRPLFKKTREEVERGTSNTEHRMKKLFEREGIFKVSVAEKLNDGKVDPFTPRHPGVRMMDDKKIRHTGESRAAYGNLSIVRAGNPR